MITKKLKAVLLKTSTFVLMLTLVFGTNIALAQNYLTTPDGPPPGNNAPAPIHEGSTGQGKYWSSGEIPPYSLASYLNIVVGMFSDWIIADGDGVAATQFCLGTAEEIDGSGFHEDGSTAGLNCITDAIGWPGVGADGQDGEDGGDGIPNTAVTFNAGTNVLSITDTQGTVTAVIPDSGLEPAFAGQTLFFNSQTGEWEPSKFLRSVDGGTADTGGDKISVGQQLPGPNNDNPAEFSINGSFKYTNPETPGSFYNGKILGSDQDGGAVEWLDPSALGLGSGIPDGTSSGEILWWDNIAQQWKLSVGGGYFNNYGFMVANNTPAGSTFTILDSPGSVNPCSANSVLRVESPNPSSPTRFFDCISQLQVTPALFAVSTVSTLITSTNEFKVTSPNAVFTKLAHTSSDPRPVCAEQDGDVVLCDNLSTGSLTHIEGGTYSFTVPVGVYEINYQIKGGGGGGGGGAFGRALYNMDAFSQIAMAGGGGGGGGGKGEAETGVLEVTPGQVLTLVVGEGGDGGCAYRTDYIGTGYFYNCNSPLSLQSIPSSGTSGAAGGTTKIMLGASTLVSVSGGQGGEHGFSFNSGMANPATALELGIATPGGAAGDNWDGTTEATEGDYGQIRHEFTNADIIQPVGGYISGQPDHSGANKKCLRQLVVAYGGGGGTGAGGANGGQGGLSANDGDFKPDTCNLNDSSYYTLGAGGLGKNGSGAFPGTGNGGGGGGGGSSIPGPYSWTDVTTFHTGMGGVGGKGGDGKIYLAW